LNAIETRKNAKKGFDRSVDRSVELGFGFCFQQKCYRGVGLLAERRRQRVADAIAGIAKIAESEQRKAI
jgi:hypothetical protein